MDFNPNALRSNDFNFFGNPSQQRPSTCKGALCLSTGFIPVPFLTGSSGSSGKCNRPGSSSLCGCSGRDGAHEKMSGVYGGETRALFAVPWVSLSARVFSYTINRSRAGPVNRTPASSTREPLLPPDSFFPPRVVRHSFKDRERRERERERERRGEGPRRKVVAWGV